MGAKTLLIAAAVALVPMMARGDLGPPPQDTYAGPKTAHIAGLTFKRIYLTLSILRGPHLVLADCDEPHPNCATARRHGVIGAWVSEVNGKPQYQTNPDKNPEVFAKVLASAPKKFVLTLWIESTENPYEGKTVKVEFLAH